MRRWRYPLVLCGLFVLLSAVLAIKPYNPGDWLLENIIAFAFVGILAATAKAFPFSRLSYMFIFIYLCFHAVGAHYTYSLVPWDSWVEGLTGWSPTRSMGWQRNHYDRFVHLIYGLLMAYPIRELFLRIADARGFWGLLLPLDMTIATSAIYELIEWGAASVLDPDIGIAYVGTQGDPWDAQRDMALAALGAVITVLATGIVAYRTQRNFAREWTESLRVKRPEPLDESPVRDGAEGGAGGKPDS